MTTRAEVYEMVESFGIPSSYYAFPTNEAPPLPYCVYYYPNRNDFFADDENYAKIENLRIELYTDTKDFELEDEIEALILFPYSKDVVYIDSEKMYQITYEMEILLTPEPEVSEESEDINA